MHPGPSELQKRYGSSLPPSLRWGAVQPHNTRSNIRERPSRLRPSLTIHDAGKTRKLVPKIERRKEAERQRRPYAFTHHDPPAEHLLLRDRPEYADYPGADQGRTSPLEGYKPADRQRVEFVLDAFGRSTKTSPFQKEQSAARAFLDRTRLGRTRRKQATVEDVEDLKDVEDEVKKPTDDQGRASGVHRGEDAPTEQGSDQKAPPKAAADRDEQAFQTEMSKRLRNLGYTEKTIRIMVDEEAARVFKQNIEKKDRPVYPKIHRDYIEPATLRHYDLPWEYDRVSSSSSCEKLPSLLRYTSSPTQTILSSCAIWTARNLKSCSNIRKDFASISVLNLLWRYPLARANMYTVDMSIWSRRTSTPIIASGTRVHGTGMKWASYAYRLMTIQAQTPLPRHLGSKDGGKPNYHYPMPPPPLNDFNRLFLTMQPKSTRTPPRRPILPRGRSQSGRHYHGLDPQHLIIHLLSKQCHTLRMATYCKRRASHPQS